MGEKSEYLLEITDLVKEFKIRKTFGGKDKNANSKIVAAAAENQHLADACCS